MLHKSGCILFISWFLANIMVCGQTSYDEAVTQGLLFQMRADSMLRLVEAQVLALATAQELQKDSIKIAIRDYDAQAVAFQNKANEWYTQILVLEDTRLAVVNNNTKALDKQLTFDQIKKVTDNTLKTSDQQKVQESEFSILSKSPYSESNPIPIDTSLPDGVVYKIQLGAFSKPLTENTFKGLVPVSGEKLPNGIIKYYVGLFRRFADTEDALRRVHEYGFKDAYIIAFYNSKIINPERARQLESGNLN